jgi:DNA polymerase-3 subunit alpha
MQRYRGKCPVAIYYQRDQIQARLPLDRNWAVSLEDELLEELKQLLGENQIQLLRYVDE